MKHTALLDTENGPLLKDLFLVFIGTIIWKREKKFGG